MESQTVRQGEPFFYEFVPPRVPEGAVTLLLLHGTGGDERDLLGLGQELAPGAALLSPRGRVLEYGMPRFFRRLGPGVFDEKDLIERTNELADWVPRVLAERGLDPQRVIALGYSNGANIAGSTLLLRPETLAGAVLLRPMVPLVPETPPELPGKRIYISSGRRDAIMPVADEPERLATLFRQSGADVTLHVEDAGHELSPREIPLAREWLRDTIKQLQA